MRILPASRGMRLFGEDSFGLTRFLLDECTERQMRCLPSEKIPSPAGRGWNRQLQWDSFFCCVKKKDYYYESYGNKVSYCDRLI